MKDSDWDRDFSLDKYGQMVGSVCSHGCVGIGVQTQNVPSKSIHPLLPSQQISIQDCASGQSPFVFIYDLIRYGIGSYFLHISIPSVDIAIGMPLGQS